MLSRGVQHCASHRSNASTARVGASARRREQRRVERRGVNRRRQPGHAAIADLHDNPGVIGLERHVHAQQVGEA